jgi:uncharacterized protein (DUF302 family)
MTLSDDIRFVRSNASFETTLQRLRDALTERGITPFGEIDHARNAREAGLDMPPTVVLIFGNARAGTPLMVKAPDIALELPLRVLVREGPDGVAVLVYRDPARLAEAFHVDAMAAAGILGLSSLVAAVAAA